MKSSKIKGWLILLGSIICFGLQGQAVSVKGKVVDENGNPLIGANVLVKNTQSGTVTDLEGQFFLDVPDAYNTTLIFSYTGYQEQSILLSGQTLLDVVLQESSVLLDEVVIVGYGTQKKSDLTGAISTVKADEIKRIPTGSAEQAIQGKIAGVQVTPVSGRPGDGAVVRIRGIGTFNDASPLYVVDGMLLNNISYLNPGDIESLEVLKDASATAIYGSRGANGVIIITTKKGERNKGAVISADAYYGWQEVTQKIDVADGAQYAQLVNELSINEGGSIRYPNPEIYGNGTDWQDVIFRTAPIMNYQVGASGGNDQAVYNVSFNYFKQEGILRGADFERFTIRLNNEYDIKKGIKLGHNIALVYNKSKLGPNLVSTALNSAPIASVYDSLGNFSPETAEFSSTGNAEASIFYNNSNRFAYQAIGNIFAEIKFLKNFTYRSNFGVQLGQSQQKDFTPEFSVSAIQQNRNSRLNVSENRQRDWLWENTLNFNKEWSNHRVDVLAGITSQEYDFEFLSGSRLNFIGESEAFLYLNAGDETTGASNNNADTWSLLSYLFRVNYTAFDKYLLTASFRADGSSKFGANNRFGYFPSIALGWNMMNEPFMKFQRIFSRLKFRGSWGVVGNEKIGTFRYSPLVTNNLNVIFGPTESLDFVQNGAAVLNLANPDLRWEETEQFNAGFEAGFLNNRLTLELDYYSRTTNDILASIPIPSYIGSEQNPIVNAASMKNSGLDLSLNWRNTSGDLSYSISIVGSTVNNEVLSLGGGRAEIFSGGIHGGWLATRTIVGQPIGSFYGWKVAGVFQSTEELGTFPVRGTEGGPGDLRFEDIGGLDGNGLQTGTPDGKISDADRVIIGNPIPDYIYGVNVSLDYKGLDLSVALNGQSGNEIFNSKKAARFGAYNFEASYLSRWTGPGTSNFEPRVTTAGHNYIPSDRFIEDGSFLRLRNVTIGYSLPKIILDKLHLTQFRIYAGGTNLVTWTKFTGYTPEIVDSGGDPFNTGFDRGFYPIAKTYTVGMNLSF